MNKKIKFLIECICTLLITLLFIAYLGYIVRPTDTDGAFVQTDTFHNLPENSLDVIIYGSSHAFRGFNIIELYDKYGIGGYNYGWHWQSASTTKAFLEDSLLTQSPKIALIETYYIWSVLKDCKMDAQIYYSRYLNDREGIRRYIKKCFPGNLSGYLAFYMPLYEFHDNWNTLSVQSFRKMKKGQAGLINSMGASTGSMEATPVVIPDQASDEQAEFSEDVIEELDEIVSICREKNVDIIFYTAPFEGVYCYADAMQDYANDRGYAYINLFDYIEETGINSETDFFDWDHLNDNGAIKVADYIGKYIKDNYDLEDKRGIKGNLWEGKPIKP